MKQKGNMAQAPKNVKSEKDGQAREQRVFNLIILDESGSMSTIAMQAVSGLNETFQTIRNAQKEHKEQRHFISFVTFNSQNVRYIMEREGVSADKDINWTDYKPNMRTPLYDAMGCALLDLKEYVGEEDVALVTIITDGEENASRKFDGRTIKKLVGQLKEKGWVFAYIGTNQDVDAVADDMGIRSRMSYEYSDRGASDMFEVESCRRQAFYGNLSRRGRQFMCESNYDYFNPVEPCDEEPEKEPDITWNMDEDNQSSATDGDNQDENNQETENQQQESSEAEVEVVNSEKPVGFWGKIRNYIMG